MEARSAPHLVSHTILHCYFQWLVYTSKVWFLNPTPRMSPVAGTTVVKGERGKQGKGRTMVRFYIDHSAELVDIDYRDLNLPLGTGWQVMSRQLAEREFTLHLAKGYTQGHYWPCYK